MERVLVTGAEGFTGHYLLMALQRQGYDVICLGLADALDLPHYHKVDICDREALHRIVQRVKPHYVIHLAAIAYVASRDIKEMYLTNIVGTHTLLSCLAEISSDVRGVVLASSANIYGDLYDGVAITEDFRPNPVNDYAVSKMAMEYMARQWFDVLPIVLARPFNYTGVGQSEMFLIPKIVSHFTEKRPIIELGNLDVSRDYSDVRNVAEAYTVLMKHGPRGEAVNICSGVTHSLTQILEMCRDITGHAIEVVQRAELMRSHEIKTLLGDNTKLKLYTSSNTMPTIPFVETLRWMLKM